MVAEPQHVDPRAAGTLWLASRSPRRRRMLADAGIAVEIEPAGIDDGTLVAPPVPPRWWVAALAYLKARWVADVIRRRDPGASGTVMGADTVCVIDDRVVGQPPDAAAAAAVIRDVAGRSHPVLTGVALIDVATGARRLVVDAAIVTCGPLSEADIAEYVSTERWRGKAGGYNLEERMAAGWPLSCDGDPATVVGLPLRKLEPRLAPWREVAS